MLTVLNDLHIGAQRTGGTTPFTQWQLRRSIISQVDELASNVDTDLLVLGDLFDTHMVPFSDWLAAWQVFGTWLAAHPKQRLWLVAGNHDLSKTSTTVGSLQALGAVLSERYSNVTLVLEPTEFEYGYIVPHLANQALFYPLEVAERAASVWGAPDEAAYRRKHGMAPLGGELG